MNTDLKGHKNYSPVYNVNGDVILPNSKNPLSLVEVFEYVFKKGNWFKFSGRADREELIKVQVSAFLFTALLMITWSIVMAAIGLLDSESSGAYVVSAITLLVFLWGLVAHVSAFVRRLHDMGRSGWWVLLAWIPFFEVWLYATEGQQGLNTYGPPTDYVKIKNEISPNGEASHKFISIKGDSNVMTFMETMKSFSFSWKGRADRREWIYTFIGIELISTSVWHFAVSIVQLIGAGFSLMESYLSPLEYVIYQNSLYLGGIIIDLMMIISILVFLVGGISTLVRRFHDGNWSAWSLLYLLIPPLAAYFSIMKCSVDDGNRYGDAVDYKMRKEKFLGMTLEEYTRALVAKVSPQDGEVMTEEQISYVASQLGVLRDKGLAYCALLYQGSHRAYLNKPGTNILFNLTLGGLGIWFLIDAFRLPAMVEAYNENRIKELAQESKEHFPVMLEIESHTL